MCKNIKQGKHIVFEEAYAILNERFINEIIDNESERQKKMMDLCVCQYCGRTSSSLEEKVRRNYLLIGKGGLQREGKADAPNNEHSKLHRGQRNSQSIESIEKSLAQENWRKLIQKERSAKFLNQKDDV